MQQVEKDLSVLARKCNSKVVDLMAKNYSSFEQSLREPSTIEQFKPI